MESLTDLHIEFNNITKHYSYPNYGGTNEQRHSARNVRLPIPINSVSHKLVSAYSFSNKTIECSFLRFKSLTTFIY